jgi:DNA replication protein DnaC
LGLTINKKMMKTTKEGVPVLTLHEVEIFIKKWNEKDRPKGILLLGPTGHGKSTLMKAQNWAYEWPNKETRTCSYDMKEIVNRYEQYGILISADQLTLAQPNKLVYFDDLGWERTAHRYGAKVNLMDELVDKYRGASYTSNLNLERLTEKYGERVVSRLKEYCYVISLQDNDFRKLNSVQEIEQFLN